MMGVIRRFRVQGHSMSPSFSHGDRILVNSFAYKLNAGDVIVFRNHGKDYLKRIRKVLGSKRFLAEGDNGSHTGSWQVSRSQIKGKYLMKYDSA